MTEPTSIRKRSRSTSGGHDPHRDIGFANPPVSGQFRPGKSGNPKGRPPKFKSPKQSFQEMLLQPVQVREAGRVKDVSTFDAILKVLRKSALEGGNKDVALLLRACQMFGVNEVGPEQEKAKPSDPEEQALLAELADLVGRDPEQ